MVTICDLFCRQSEADRKIQEIMTRVLSRSSGNSKSFISAEKKPRSAIDIHVWVLSIKVTSAVNTVKFVLMFADQKLNLTL